MSKLSVHLVTWNGAKYIPYLFNSLRAQTFRDWELLVIDNASTDDTVSAVQKELLNFPVPARIIVNKLNNGFAGGHNQAYKETQSEYFMILNQDMYLPNNCFEMMVGSMDALPGAAAIAPRLMKWQFQTITTSTYNHEQLARSFSNVVDALGLRIYRNRRVVEQYTGCEWSDDLLSEIPAEPHKPLMVFGVSGTMVLFRRFAVEQIGDIFDASLNSYKEDVDFSYRLREARFDIYVLPYLVAYHDRTGQGTKHSDDFSAAKNKLQQPSHVQYYSYRNQFAVLYKNEYWQNFALDFPWIIWYELKKFVWFLLFDRSVLRGLGELWRMRRELKIKRKQNLELRKVSWQEMRKWWRV